MSDDKYRPELGFGAGKESPGIIPPEAEGGQEPTSTPKKYGRADEREELSNALEKSSQNAEEAGRSAARRFRDGLFMGAGKKVAEFAWDKVKELIGQGDS